MPKKAEPAIRDGSENEMTFADVFLSSRQS
jgi:hypothetical protein